MSSQTQPEMSPLAGALSITASVFVAGASIFVAIIAFVAGMHQLDGIGLANTNREPSSAARWWSFALGFAILLDGIIAGARARKNARVALATTVLFFALSSAIGTLYIATW